MSSELLWLYSVAFFWCFTFVSADINSEIREFINSKDLLGISACSGGVIPQNGVLELGPVLQEPISPAKKSTLLNLMGNDRLFRFKLNLKPLSCSKEPLIYDVSSVPDEAYLKTVAFADEYNNGSHSLLLKSLQLPFYFTFYGYFKHSDQFYSREQYCIAGYK